MTGVDISIPELAVSIHQPTIKEISYLGEISYFMAIQMLCFNRATLIASNQAGSSVLEKLNNFQIFMTLISDPRLDNRAQLIQDILSVLTILFPAYTCQLLPTSLYFVNSETKEHFILDGENFDAFRNVLMEVAAMNNSTGGQNSLYNPHNDKAAKIAAKMMNNRARVSKQKGYSADGTLARYVSILTIGLSSMSLNDCLNLTVYQIYDLIERYGLYTGWDLDIRSRLAGASPDNKPDDWMKDIH